MFPKRPNVNWYPGMSDDEKQQLKIPQTAYVMSEITAQNLQITKSPPFEF